MLRGRALAHYRRLYGVATRQPGHHLDEWPVALELLELADAEHINRPASEPLLPLRRGLRLDHERHVPQHTKGARIPVRPPEHGRYPRGPGGPGGKPSPKLLPPPEPAVHRGVRVEDHGPPHQPRHRNRHQPERRRRVPHHHYVRPQRPHLAPGPHPQAYRRRLSEDARVQHLVNFAPPPPQRQERYLMPRVQQRLYGKVLVRVVPRSRKDKPQGYSLGWTQLVIP